MTAQPDTERPEQHVQPLDQLPLWQDKGWQRLRGNLPECWDCSAAFDPDSSPDLVRCWQCAEYREQEASC